MRVMILTATLFAVLSVGIFTDRSVAQNANGIRIATASPTVEETSKFTLILFWKENDAVTQAMTEALRSAVAKRSQRAEWTSVNIKDYANRAVVERYQVGRAPMPMVLCVAPNGAITGAIPRKLNEEAVDRVLVTPAMASATKALQENKIVVIHVKRDAQSPLPTGAADLMADPAFNSRTATVNVALDDPAESRFVNSMEIKPDDVNGSMLVVLGPPGVLVGKFPASVTKDQIAVALHAAGKCCNDPNCKHNQKAQ